MVQISKRQFNDTSTETIAGDFSTSSLGDDGLSAFLNLEDGWGEELVPFLFREGVDGLLLATLLGFGETLVLSLLLFEGER